MNENTICAVIAAAALAMLAVNPLAARDVTSFSVDSFADTAAMRFEAGEAGDRHVIYYAWSNDGEDKGDDIQAWPNVARIGLVAEDETSKEFELPARAKVIGKYVARVFIAETDKEFDYLVDGVCKLCPREVLPPHFAKSGGNRLR
jgi:hypothetical protein